MGLQKYRGKRDFAATPEPAGTKSRTKTRRAAGFSYVVQRHAARRLHYDFRLELGGVLKSWAIPKGPSLDPADKRLAVETEDHPIEYGDFEGEIPRGQYGGGSVVIWDRGTWTPHGDPSKGLEAGKLAFTLHGEKLKGGWALVKLKGRSTRNGREWLLVKERDADAAPGSHRRSQSQAKPGSLPRFVEPQQAQLVDRTPDGDEWLHEKKYDGYRILARVERGRARLLSRNGNDWTDRFPEVADALAAMPLEHAWIDGEVAVVLGDGTTSFAALQNRGRRPQGTALAYFVFDLLFQDGRDLRGAPLEERKRLLAALVPRGAEILHYSDHVIGSGRAFFDDACRKGLEGVMSKRRDGLYHAGRGRDWLKSKCLRVQEFVIGGFTEPSGSRVGIGALLLGVHGAGGALEFAGKVGTGFTEASARELRRRLERIERRESPFSGGEGRARKAHFVEPTLVAQVRFTEWTRDGSLRHPAFEGLREDKDAAQVRREEPNQVEPKT